MTKNSYLKHEIRTRMELTGESYSTASRAVARGDELSSAEPSAITLEKYHPAALANRARVEKIAQLKALIVFAERASALWEGTGMTHLAVFEILAPRTEDPRLRGALLSVIEDARGDGQMGLLEALGKRPDEFPGIFIPMVAANGNMQGLASVYRTELELL